MTSTLVAPPHDGASDGARADREFLPTAPRLDPRTRRRHQLVLALLILFGLLKGGYWVVATQVWSPVDEAQHFGYVESLATGNGIPTVGRDLLSDDVMASLKASTDTNYRSEPFRPDNDDENWGSTRHQYEAIHGPTYYALMVPAYWLGKPAGTTGSLFAVRMATVAVALVAVPLTWLLARRLFPTRPAAWLLAPAVLVTINGFSLGSVTNDALVVPLAAASLVVLLRALHDSTSRGWALAAGATVGLTLVTKTTAIVLLPLVVLAVIAWLVTCRPPLRRAAEWVAFVAIGAAVTIAPWLAWNLWAYSALSAAKVVDELTGNVLPSEQLNWAGIERHAMSARMGLWASQLATDGIYRRYWEWAVVVSFVAGVVAAAVRRSWQEMAALVWCGVSLLLAFASMEVLVFVLFGGAGGPVGRHLHAALPPTAVMMGAAAVLVLGRRWGPVAIAALLVWSLALESRIATEIAQRTYLDRVVDPDLAPVDTQTWSDGLAQPAAVTVRPDCRVEAVGLGFTSPAPPLVTVRAGDAATVGRLVPETAAPARLAAALHPVYRLDDPVEGPFVVELAPDTTLNVSAADRDPDIEVDGIPGDAVLSVLCRSAEADEVAFAQTYPTLHPDAITLSFLTNAPRALVGIAGAAALGLAGTAAVGAVQDRRRVSRPKPARPDQPRRAPRA